jgi:alpha-tubulin suppressor-like RCC1 family protein
LPDHITLDETKKDLNSIKTQKSVLIEKIFCGNRFSGMLLSNGEFWACGNCPQAAKAVLMSAKQANEVSEEESKREKQILKDEDIANTNFGRKKK